MQQPRDDAASPAWVAAYPTVRRLAGAGALDAAEALLDRRTDVVLAITAQRRLAATQAMHDAGRALVGLLRGDTEAARVHATGAITLRRALGPSVETDRWLLDVAALARLGGAVGELRSLRRRVRPLLGANRNTMLDVLVEGEPALAREVLEAPLEAQPLPLAALPERTQLRALRRLTDRLTPLLTP